VIDLTSFLFFFFFVDAVTLIDHLGGPLVNAVERVEEDEQKVDCAGSELLEELDEAVISVHEEEIVLVRDDLVAEGLLVRIDPRTVDAVNDGRHQHDLERFLVGL